MFAIEIGYYDRILLAIVSCVVGGGLIGALAPVAIHTGIFGGSLVATFFVYDALFRNPPLPPSDTRIAVAAIIWHAMLFVLVLTVYVS